MSVKLVMFSPERNELAIREFNKYPEYGHDENLWELCSEESDYPCRFTFNTLSQARKLGWYKIGIIDE